MQRQDVLLVPLLAAVGHVLGRLLQTSCLQQSGAQDLRFCKFIDSTLPPAATWARSG